MADIINLRNARKQKARQTKEQQASENRARFGQPKAARKLTEARDDLAARQLDGHKMDET